MDWPDAGEPGGAGPDQGTEAIVAQGALLLQVGAALAELLGGQGVGEQGPVGAGARAAVLPRAR